MVFLCLNESKFNLNLRRELQTAQNENFQLEKKIHELQMSIQNPSMASRLSDLANGPQSGINTPTMPPVVRKYYEMKYGDKSSTTSSPLPLSNNTANFDSGLSSISIRNGGFASKGQQLPASPALSSVPQPNITMGARSSTFKFSSKLPDSIQNTLVNTGQSLQSKLPTSLQNLPASFTRRPTINMLANKLQNAFS